MLIEDAACAVGQSSKDVAPAVSVMSRATPSRPKVLTTGQGGAVLTNDAEVRDNVIRFTDHATRSGARPISITASATTCAATTFSRPRHGPARHAGRPLSRRRASYAVLTEELPDHIYRIPGNEAPLHNIVLADNPAALVAALGEKGIRAAAVSHGERTSALSASGRRGVSERRPLEPPCGLSAVRHGPDRGTGHARRACGEGKRAGIEAVSLQSGIMN